MHPVTRLSIGLIALTVSILLIGELLGFVPDRMQLALEARKDIAETLAVQLTFAAEREDAEQIETTLDWFLKKNTDVLSVGMRKNDGSLYAVAGDHEKLWKSSSSEGLFSPTHIRIPVMQGNQSWGAIELNYAPLSGSQLTDILRNSFAGMLLYVAVAGFFGYLIFLRRALKELNPSKVIPQRVRSAFDTLSEGVLILDMQGQILLANNAFCKAVRSDPDALTGIDASSFKWKKYATGQSTENRLYPWSETLKDRMPVTGARLCLNLDDRNSSIYTVNSTPILDSNDQCKGALVTFDDITEIESKNIRLRATLEELEASQNEIFRQNNELKMLAEIDPLTGCYNRRALFSYFDTIFAEIHGQHKNLVCLMLDIDHFKSVNDNYGHQTGDEVIKLVSRIIRETLRETDIAGRYGGEEFCVVLPDVSNDAALGIAERIRTSVMNSPEYPTIGIKGATISLGMSSSGDNAPHPAGMVDLADQALYFAKKNGRNRIGIWNRDCRDQTVTDEAPAKKNISHAA